jgi:hypothetical protein
MRHVSLHSGGGGSSGPVVPALFECACDQTVGGVDRFICGAALPGTRSSLSASVVWRCLGWDAVAFYKSKAWTDLAPQRDKSQKTIRRYVVEVER